MIVTSVIVCVQTVMFVPFSHTRSSIFFHRILLSLICQSNVQFSKLQNQ